MSGELPAPPRQPRTPSRGRRARLAGMVAVALVAVVVAGMFYTGVFHNWFVKAQVQKMLEKFGDGEDVVLTLSATPRIVSGPAGELSYDMVGGHVLRLPQNAWAGDARWHVDGGRREERELLFEGAFATHRFRGGERSHTGFRSGFDTDTAAVDESDVDARIREARGRTPGVEFSIRSLADVVDGIRDPGRGEDLPPGEVLDQLVLLPPGEVDEADDVRETLRAFGRIVKRRSLLRGAPSGPARRFRSDHVSGWLIGDVPGARPVTFLVIDPDRHSVLSIHFQAQPHVSAETVDRIMAGLDVQPRP